MNSFLKKNRFFVILCTAFVLVIASLVGYKVYEDIKAADADKPQQKEPSQTPVVTEKDPSIQDFVGEYHKDSGQVSLSWRLEKNNAVLTSMKLYHVRDAGTAEEKETKIDDVSVFSEYNIPQSVYALPTGANVFRIRATFEGKDDLVVDTKVSIPLLLSAKQEESIDLKNNSVDVTLVYVYGKNHPVSAPSLMVLNSEAFATENMSLVGTKSTEDGDGFITAKTTYRLKWSTPQVPEPFKLRWRFDTITRSFDFLTDLQKK